LIFALQRFWLTQVYMALFIVYNTNCKYISS
jgi:hypothetical protein